MNLSDASIQQAHARRWAVGIVLVAAAVTATHWPALSARAVSFDDDQYLIGNFLVRNPSLAHAGRFFTEVLEPSTVGGYYQPLNMISLMLDSALGGSPENLRPYHATSLLLHVLNTLLVAFLLRTLFRDDLVALLVAVLFGLHPMTVETIPWIGERKTLLATFFALLATLVYVRYVRANRRAPAWYVACVLFFILALLAKPTVTPLPVMLLLMDLWPLGRFCRRAVWDKVPMLLIAASSSVITMISQKRTADLALPSQQSPLEAPLRICHNIIFYPMKMLWPADLSSHYPPPPCFDLSQPFLLTAVIGAILLALLLAVSWRESRAPAVAWMIFIIGLFPTMQLFGFSNVIASDKYAYFPAIGLLLLLTCGLTAWRRNAGASQVRAGLLVTITLLLAALEVRGVRAYYVDWRDTESLYRRMVRLAPQAPSIRSHLGNCLLQQGRVDEALEMHAQAAQVGADRPEALNDYGNALRAVGRLDDAIELYRAALNVFPDYYVAHRNLGVALAEKGDVTRAIEHFRESIRVHPRNPEAYYNLATVLIAQGKTAEATALLRTALAYQPDYTEAHVNLAIVLEAQGRADEALKHFEAAVRWKPENAEARFNLAQALIARGRALDAVPHLREVLRRNPADADASRLLDSITTK